MTPLLCRSASLPADMRPWVEAIVATLPRTLRQDLEGDNAAIDLIDGRTHWAQEALAVIERGRRALFVVEPGIAAAETVLALADAVERSGALFALADPYQTHPALAEFEAEAAGDRSAFVLRCVSGREPASALLATIRAARTLGLTALVVDDVQSGDRSALLSGEAVAGGRRVTIRLAVVAGNRMPAQMTISVYGPLGFADLALPGGRDARPATVRTVGLDTIRGAAPRYESAHRHALATFSERTSAADARALRELADDVALVASLPLQSSSLRIPS